MKYPYRLPLKFILLWVLNIAVLLAVVFGFDLHHILRIKDLTYIILFLGALMTLLEEWLIDKLKGNE